MSKVKGKKSTNKNKDPEIDESSLSLWQRENLRYMKKKGAKPHWQDPLPKEEEQEVAPEEKSEEESDEEKKPVASEAKEEKQTIKERMMAKLAHGRKKRVSFAERLPNLRDQSYKLLRKRMTILLVAFVIPLLFLLYYVSPFSRVQKITVTGNQAVATEAIVDSSDLKIGENIFGEYFSWNHYAENILKENPQVRSAALHFTNPVSFEIEVSEYQEIAVLLKARKYYPILENGTVLETEIEEIEGFPVLEDFEDEGIIQATITAYHELPEAIQNLIQTIQYTPTESDAELLTLTMSDGNQVLVPYSTMIDQMAYYEQVAAQMTENGVIDMEVGIFSYPYGNNERFESSSESSTENSSENAE